MSGGFDAQKSRESRREALSGVPVLSCTTDRARTEMLCAANEKDGGWYREMA
jgi:hypothetical protein